MQSRTQEQLLAPTAVKSHYPTNGKEEEVKTGEAQKIYLYLKSGQVGSTMQPLLDQQIALPEVGEMRHHFSCS